MILFGKKLVDLLKRICNAVEIIAANVETINDRLFYDKHGDLPSCFDCEHGKTGGCTYKGGCTYRSAWRNKESK